MDLYAGSSTGAIKGINLADNSFLNCNSVSSLNPKEDEVASLCWAPSGDDTEFLCAQLNRQLKLYDTVSGTFTPLFKAEGGQGKIRGLDTICGTDKLATAVESGVVKVWNLNGESETEIAAGGSLNRMRGSPVKQHSLATGGKENPLKMWDFNSPDKPIFTAKNVRNDWLDLRVPIWVSDMRFLPDSEQIVTCTGHHQIRLYDPKTPQRRPVTQMDWLDQPLTAVSVCSKQNQVVAGNSQGEMGLFDLRGKGKLVHVFKGCVAGSIRAIECHPTEPYVASCGVDRFLRVHHLETRELLHKIYCKTALNCVLMKKNLSILDKNTKSTAGKKGTVDGGSDSENVSDSSDDELWEGMEIVGREKKSKKRKTHEPEDQEKDFLLEKRRKLKSEEVSKRKRKQEDEEKGGNSNDGCIETVVKRKVTKLFRKQSADCDGLETKILGKRKKKHVFAGFDTELKRVKIEKVE